MIGGLNVLKQLPQRKTFGGVYGLHDIDFKPAKCRINCGHLRTTAAI